jgi:hypothetical protein
MSDSAAERNAVDSGFVTYQPEGTDMARSKPKKRSTALNMTPVAGVHPTITTLYARTAKAGISMRQLCLIANPPVHHDVPARWRRGATQPTVRVLQTLFDALEEYEKEMA